MDRLVEKFDIDPATGCWNWTAARGGSRAGYGVIGRGRAGEGMVYAHRVAWEESVEPIPDGLTIDHLCRNTLCVNPDHLEPVPHGTNLLRGETLNAANVSKTHCPHGHSYDDAIVEGNGNRKCRTCNRERCRRRRMAG